MKKTLLITAALVALATSAQADFTLAPTSTLIGRWCEVKKDSNQFRRGACPKGWENNWNTLIISQNGYEFWEWGCTFIQRKDKPNGIEAVAECGFGEEYEFDKVSF